MTSFQFRFISPLHLYPESPPKVAPKRATNPLPSHGLTAEYFSWSKPKETTKTDSPTISKWQIGLFLWQKPARREPERSAASAKRAGTSYQGSRGAAPGAPLVTFPATGKSPGVWGGAPKLGGVGAASPAQTPGGWGGAPKSGGVGAASPSQTLPGVPSMARPCSRGAPADAARVEKETAQSKTAPSLWCLCIGKLSD